MVTGLKDFSIMTRLKKFLLRSKKSTKIWYQSFFDFTVSIRPISDFPENILIRIEQEAPFNAVGPMRLHQPQLKTTFTIPALHIYKFHNALINVRSSGFIVNKQLIVESFHSNENFAGGFVKEHTPSQAVIKYHETLQIDEGFYLGGNGSWNWYHWLIEILPKALLWDLTGSSCLLISSDVKRYPSFRDTLTAIVGEDVKLIFLDPNKNYYVKQLILPNNISYVPFNLPNTVRLQVRDSFVRSAWLTKLRDKLVNHFKSSTEPSHERIFLYRTHSRVAKNQDELLVKLEEDGFTKLNFDVLSVTAQIQYIRNAKIVIGITGAAFTNLIFAQPNAKFICFVPMGFEEVSCFSNLANIFGVQLYYHHYKLDAMPDKHYLSDFSLNIDEIMDMYRKIVYG
jgi:capsular polysaccharide biosynthesis protein